MATYYVDTANGNDGNAGTSEGAGNAWATIQKAMDTVAAGDKVYVKATGTYSEDVTMETAGSASGTGAIVVEGYTTTVGDDGKITISGTTNCLTTGTLSTGEGRYHFNNIIFSGGSAAAVSIGAIRAIVFRNCEFTGAGTDGFLGSGTQYIFINCEVYSNTQDGITAASMTSGYIAGCSIHSNARAGVATAGLTGFCHNLVYNNDTAAAGWDHANLGDCDVLIGNTFDGENRGADLVKIDDVSNDMLIYNNIIYDSGANGVLLIAGQLGYRSFCGYNLVNDNTTNDYNVTTIYEWGYGDVTSAPAFTDEANDDYTLGASPAIDAGMQPGGIT